jgi:pyruvate/2-oxoglutarate dehydrogenase complex dihydrolipoamide dehydrogenase (E3) component
MAEFDAIVVGAGQAGPSLAGRLSAAGMKVAMIERHLFGGTCVNTGCIPTKTLIASAYVAHSAQRAREFGIEIDGAVRIDMRAVKARKDAISGHVRDGLEQWLRGLANVTVLKGTAQFEDSDCVRVGTERLRAAQIFLNVGARASVPPLPGIEQTRYLTNSSIMEVDALPRHLLIVGGSYVGLEFAQMYRRFGAQVTVIEQSARLVSREDEEVSATIQQFLEAEGIHFRLNAKCIRMSPAPEGVTVGVDCLEGEPQLTGSHLLLAVGRRPNTEDLGLKNAGVATDARGYIEVDDQCHTNVPGIWALGECNGRGAFTHTAYNDYEIVAANLFDKDSRKISDRIPCYALFTDPPLGRIGMTEAQARKAGHQLLVATLPMSSVKRAVERGETRGFMKVIVDADSQQILGAALLGLNGDEVVHSLLDIMYARAPYSVVRRAVHIHPTVSELLPTLLGQLHP